MNTHPERSAEPRRRSARALGVRTLDFLLLLLVARSLMAQRPGSFREQARVERVIVDAYVTDARGDPIPNLTAASFRLRVDGNAVPIESVEWIPADQPEAVPLPSDTSAGEAARTSQIAPGRLLIFFFQTDLSVTSRILGEMRMALQARRLVRDLLPTDRVAILSFDSHLKLRQDFTDDHDKLLTAIEQAILTGPPSEPIPTPGRRLRATSTFAPPREPSPPRKRLRSSRAPPHRSWAPSQ